MLLATLSLRSTLRTYEVSVHWNVDLDPRGQPRPGSQLSPTLVVQCLKIVERFEPEQSLTLAEMRTQPSHLICMPSVTEGGNDPASSPPTITTIFSTITQTPGSSLLRTFSSRLVSHAVNESTETLHSSFTSMAARRGKSLANTTRVRLHILVVSKHTNCLAHRHPTKSGGHRDSWCGRYCLIRKSRFHACSAH